MLVASRVVFLAVLHTPMNWGCGSCVKAAHICPVHQYNGETSIQWANLTVATCVATKTSSARSKTSCSTARNMAQTPGVSGRVLVSESWNGRVPQTPKSNSGEWRETGRNSWDKREKVRVWLTLKYLFMAKLGGLKGCPKIPPSRDSTMQP